MESFESSLFLRLLSAQTAIDYNQARSGSVDEELVAEELKRYKFGHDRYFFSQSSFIRCARQANLEVVVQRCEQNDYPIFMVAADRFRFTFHYGLKPGEITYQHISLVRRQNSIINKEIVEPTLFSSPVFNTEKLKDADIIYANIIHGCAGTGMDFANNGFLRIAIPSIKFIDNKENFIFVSNVNLYDVLQLLEARDAVKTQAVPMVDTAIPRVKKHMQL